MIQTRSHYRLVATLFLLALLASIRCACHAQNNDIAAYQETIPYTAVMKGVPAIDITLNGTTKARMAVDSGTVLCCISDKLAAKLGLASGPFAKWPSGPMIVRGKALPLVMISRLDMGRFQLTDTAFAILDSEHMGGPDSGIDGLIGANVLTVFPMFFDFQKHRITLFSKSPWEANLKAVGMDDAKAVPVQGTNEDYRFTCPITVTSGSSAAVDQLHIDTGSVTTVISKKTAIELGLTPFGSNLILPTGDYDFQIDQALISNISISGLPASVSEIYYSTDDLPAGSALPLGLDVLSHYKILLDFSKKVMYIKPAEAAVSPTSPANAK